MRHSRVLACVVALAVGTCGTLAARAAGETAATATAPAATRPASLEKTMGNMGKLFGQISKQVKDKAQKDSTLKLLGDLEGYVVVAKGLTPPIKRAAAADQPHAATDFRAMLSNVLRELLSVEEQVSQDKFDDAADTFDGIKKIIETGHKEFKVGQDD
jgi:hypothetical protein